MNIYNTRKTTGNISSIETMGLVDGPGVRTVVFMQGCLLRCKYCHNPETWPLKNKVREYTPDELSDYLLKYKPYMKHGGVTFSGGDPLLQSAFLYQTAALLKQQGIHICIDTSGAVLLDDNVERLLDLTDLVILDVKAVHPAEYEAITGRSMALFQSFLEFVQKKSKRLWLRTVIVPGINNDLRHMNDLRKFYAQIKNVDKTEFLPYHTMGVQKYTDLGIQYPLTGVPEISDKDILCV